MLLGIFKLINLMIIHVFAFPDANVDYFLLTVCYLFAVIVGNLSKLEESIAELQAHNGIVPDSSTDDPPSKIITDV